MAIQFTEEQAMLLETADGFCRQHGTIDHVRSRLDAPGVDRATWDEMAALGWLGINVPEQYGGLAMGLGSVTPVAESLGRYLVGSPYTGHVLATEALITSGAEDQKQQWLPRLVSGDIATIGLSEPDGSWLLDEVDASAVVTGDNLRLSGTKCFVTDADAADVIAVSVQYDGEARLVLLEGSDIPPSSLHREIVIDQTRRSFAVSLDGIVVPVDRLMPGRDFASIERAALLLLSAEISGGLAGILPVIVDYLTTRKAFGRAIGSYQSLKHPTVDILLSLEAARSHLYEAAGLVDDADTREAEIALRIAKAHGSQVFAFAGDRAVQFHGGFGFTFECDAQLYLRRALWCQYQFGDERYHKQLLEPLLLSQA